MTEPLEPIELFKQWYACAKHVGLRRKLISWVYPFTMLHQPDAVTLATATRDGKPSARVVLFKGLKDGRFGFYTNYTSRKGQELAENPQVAMTFHWCLPERQIRIEGRVEKMTAAESQAYWNSRPRGSQTSGAASPQSQRIESREGLKHKVAEVVQSFEGKAIPCPEFWGGYHVVPERIEFWEARLNRLHDRLVYVRENGAWKTYRLAP
ncbi:pyridoxamine 5'-phosphate oxidase [Bdellovibrionota bacterium FG-1]